MTSRSLVGVLVEVGAESAFLEDDEACDTRGLSSSVV